MQFKVMSQKDAVEYTKHKHSEKSLLISIIGTRTDRPNLEPPNNVNNIQKILQLKFDDIQTASQGYQIVFWKKDEALTFDDNDTLDDLGLILFNQEIAETVVQCVAEWVDKVDLIICHCSAGISRSAGCCAAIMKALTGDDSDIFNNPMYHPNMTVYYQLIKAFANYGRYTDICSNIYGNHRN